nr:MAG TPA: hypothetical protein [Caudoviricetes sp.]
MISNFLSILFLYFYYYNVSNFFLHKDKFISNSNL